MLSHTRTHTHNTRSTFAMASYTELFQPGALLLVKYGSTQVGSVSGANTWRTILVDQEGTGKETEYGKEDDDRHGWWIMQGDGTGSDVLKFFFEERIIDARGCTVEHAKRQADCPQRITMIPSRRDRGQSPARRDASTSPARASRSRSHSRSP
jgi:hypothetical protein